MLAQGVGGPYDPGMMTYNGSTGYYSGSFTASGNKITFICRINRAAFTGGGTEYLTRVQENASPFAIRLAVILFASDHATADQQSKVRVFVQNAAGTQICSRISTTTVCDGADHVLEFSFDADAGTDLFYIEGAADANTSATNNVNATTGTLPAGTMNIYVGRTSSASAYFSGTMGYYGISNSYRTNLTDFYHPTNGLQQLDESGWTEWGAQPIYWNQYGTMSDNKGSAANLTANGTITGPA